MFLKNDQDKRRSRRSFSRWSIVRRLALLYAASSIVMLLLAVTYLYWSLADDAERDDKDFLANKIQECRRLLNEHPTDSAMLAHEIQSEAAASQFIKYYVRLLDNRGLIVLETPDMTDALPARLFPPPISETQVPSRGTVWKSPAGASYLLMAAQARLGAMGTGPQTLQVALDVSSDETFIAGYRWKLLAVVTLGILFSAIAGVFVARKGLHPLKEITQATERITANQLHDRIVCDGWPLELASLARSFDRMLDRLEDSFKRLSQFSADLAHELRTPINNLRGEAGVALSQSRTPEEYRRTLESSLEEYARLTRLIDNLLFLARAESPEIGISSACFDARKAIEAVRDYYEALADDRGVELRCDGAGEVTADPVLFRQAVSNLLSNALNCTSSGGRVLIRASQNNGSFNIVVSDTGCGIAPEHLPRLFDRLYRVDAARSQNPNGAGLGLAIVKSIMTLHGGSVEAQSAIGKGSTFTLTFPLGAERLAKLTKM